MLGKWENHGGGRGALGKATKANGKVKWNKTAGQKWKPVADKDGNSEGGVQR